MGIGTQEELSDAWLDIYSEFYEISEDEQIKAYIQERADVMILESKVYRVKYLCKLLVEDGYNDKFAELLSGMGYKISEKTMFEDIETIVRKLNNDEVKLGLMNKKEEAKKPNHAMFDEKISAIERLFKVPINTHTISTQMFAIKCKEFDKECQRIMEENEKRNGFS